jgi:hypothetical protein
VIPILFAAAALARDLPNYDATAKLRVAASAAHESKVHEVASCELRVANTSRNAQLATRNLMIPTEWYTQYGTPSFVWLWGRQEIMASALDSADGAYVSETHDTGRGAIITRYRQRIDGIDVFRNELSVVTARDGTPVAMSGHLAAPALHAASNAASRWRLSADDAIARALADYGDGTVTSSRTSRIWFDLGTSLEPAHSIELELAPDNDMYAYVISAADGRLLFRKNLTEDATYRVWADPAGQRRPLNGPQGFAGNPHPTGTNDGFQATLLDSALVTLANGPISTADPWLAASATQTTGNNVDAYADLLAPDGFSAGDVRAIATAPGTFDHHFDLQSQPDAGATQRMAAITQLFYDVNFLHDWFYDSGFNEAARNAQSDNYGRGGSGNDSIRAEAQDYSGRNNANMSTPSDGGRPRMQMYVFDAIAFRALDVDAPASIAGRYGVGTAVFGQQAFTVSGEVVTTTPADGCAPVAGTLAGKIAFINRGTCNFAVKAANAKAAGALAVIVGNVAESPDPTSYVRMGCASTTCTAAEAALIPALHVPLETANALRAQLAAGALRVTLRRDAGIDRDGSIDNSIVAHEWGHYLSNRLIANSAGLTSPQSRGMGEGWSDFVALLLTTRAEDTAIASNATFNGVFPVATYVRSGGANGPEPNGGYYFGIRRVPYSTDMTRNPLTLRHITNGVPVGGAPVAFGVDGSSNAEVHSTGEVWATMLWECYAALLRDTLGDQPRLAFAEAQKRMKDYLVASLKITPADPTFLDARNALLAAAFAADRTDYLRFWQAFAKRGAGTRAVVAERFSTANTGVTEDFTLGGDAAVAGLVIDDSPSTCKRNGALEGGEDGLLVVTVRNSGSARLSATTARVLTDDPRLILDAGGMLAIPPSDPGESVTAALHVSLAPGTTPLAPMITIILTDPDFAIAESAVFASRFRLNVHDEAKRSAFDDFETPATAWSAPANARWTAVDLSSTQRVWQAVERFVRTDASLTSPPLAVATNEPFRIVFRHRHWFDATADANGNLIPLDGGVVEISTDDGQSWSDVGAPGYSAAPIETGNSNPLEGRRAFAGISPGATLETPSTSLFTTSTIDLGTSYAGRRVRIRFRIGTGTATNGLPRLGWQIDNIALTGITNLPFHALVSDRGLCTIDGTTTELRAAGAAGAPLVLQATVSSTLATPDGTVEFLENGEIVGAAPLLHGVATWNPSSFLAPGTHTIRASYLGTANFVASNASPVTITLAPPARRRAVR